jgi:hypothetical protein
MTTALILVSNPQGYQATASDLQTMGHLQVAHWPEYIKDMLEDSEINIGLCFFQLQVGEP